MGALVGILSSILGGLGQVGGAIGAGIGKVGGGLESALGRIWGGVPGTLETFPGPEGPEGPPAPPARTGGLQKLFQNNLLAQLLAAEGADLMGNTPGKNIGGAIQQNIASQNYMKVLQRMLAGQIPDGGKITQDSKGMTIAVPPPPAPSPEQPTFQTGSIAPDIRAMLRQLNIFGQ